MQTFSGSQSAQENKDWGIDITSLLAGDVILSVSWSCTKSELQLSRQSSNQTAGYVFISGGIGGRLYTIRFVAVTVTGRTIECHLLMYIQPN